jgi:hypothetical protein
MDGFKKAAKRSGFTLSEPSYELGQNVIIEKTAEAIEKNANPDFINSLLQSLQGYGQQGVNALQNYGQQAANFAQPYINQGIDAIKPQINQAAQFAQNNPTAVGAGVGALAGGGLGALSSEHALRNAILGALTGGGAGAGIGYGLGNYRQNSGAGIGYGLGNYRQNSGPETNSFDFARHSGKVM